MKYLGDITEGATIRGSFPTRAKATGAPITLAGSPALAVYKDASTTEITSGVTLAVDFDSRTGHHVWTVDTSADAAYTTGSDYRVVLTAGTVDSESVVGVEVGCFSIQNRYSSVDLSPVIEDTQDIRSRLPAALVGGRMDASVGAMAANTLTAAAIAADAGAELAALVETYIVNEGDATAVLQAVADKIAADWVAGDASPLAIVAAIKADATLATMISRIDTTVGSRLASASYTAPANSDVAAIKVVTDRINTGLVADGPVWQFTANMLELGPSASGGSGTGTGARTVTITVNDGTTALQNAKVRLSEGANTFVGTTNASGVVTFNLDDATYTVAITKSGYSYAGTTLAVDGTETVTYSMTAVTITPGSDTGEVTGYFTVRDENNNPESGVTIYCRMTCMSYDSTGDAHDGANRAATSAGNGVVQFQGLLIGGTYLFWRGDESAARKVTIPDDDETQAGTYALPDIVGAA